MWLSLIVGAGLLGCGGEMTAGKSSSATSTQSERRVVNKYQAKDIISGCCRGAGGSYNSAGICVIRRLGNESAFKGCVGNNVTVEYENGNRYPLEKNLDRYTR